MKNVMMALTTVFAGVMTMGVMAESTNTVKVTKFHQPYPYMGKATVEYTVGGTLPVNAVAEITLNTDDASATFVQSNIVTGANMFTIDFASSFGGALLLTNASFVVTIAGELGGVQLWENGPYWAECNVGASKPEDYGYYFWWGDTVGYTNTGSGWISVKDGTSMSFSSSSTAAWTYSKNNSALQSAGYIDAAGNLVAAYDAAAAHLGSPWRIPTDAEISALGSNCTTDWITTNGINGRLVTGKGEYTNRSIFLPAAGNGDGSDLNYVSSNGYYWSSTPGGSSYDAWRLLFGSSSFTRYCSRRYYGRSVRPVRGFAEVINTVGVVTYDSVLVAIPIIEPSGAEFENVSQAVSLSCSTDGATILYTTDGSDPKVNGREYTKPFAIYKSCTVRAIAVKYDWKDSPEATATFTRGESLSEAANLYGYTMETDSAALWTVDATVSHDGVSSVRSGAIGSNGTTYLMASVKKAGTVSFWWKAQCEEPDEEDGEDGYYDYGAFLVDDVVKARIAGNDTGWRFMSVEVPTGGKHVLRWEYRKDGVTSYAPDCVWLDQVQWTPADGSGFTMTSPEQVPYSWLSTYGFGGRDADFETAANAPSGKRDGSGKDLSVWQDYVAGTDPTNETSRFSAKIEMRDGLPVLTWEPDLNENGTKSERLYKVYGKENLTDAEWAYPTNSLHRFFKVTVEMP